MAIGEGQISTQNVISHLVRDAGSDEVNEEVEQEALPLKQVERTKKTTSSLGISVKGVGDIWVKLARCCMPVPGDQIIGFITRNQGVSVHRVDCQNMLDLQKRQPERVVDVQWTSTKGVFMVKIQVEALDRPHLLSDVTRVLSDHGVNIISGSICTLCSPQCARLKACSMCTVSPVPRIPPNLAYAKSDTISEAVRLI